MSILGNRVLRTEDPRFLTVGGSYVDDLVLEGAAYVTYVRSTVAHARITSIEVEDARSAPGVLAIYTADDVDLDEIPPDIAMLNQAMTRPWLAKGVVRFVGEPVAAIVTEEKYQGPDAAEQVWVDYEPLPIIVDVEESLKDEVIIHEAAGTNLALDLSFGHSDDLFDGCEVVIRQRVLNQRVAPCPLEVRAAAVRWEADGRLTQWASTQNPHGVRDDLSRLLGIEPENVHVISPDVGGGFGAKIGVYPEELLLGWMSQRVGRPLKWVETRSESMVALGHGRGQIQDIELGGTRDGTLQAYRLTILQDAGAYPRIGAVLPWMTRVMASGVYAIPKVEFNSRSFMTNTTPTVAYRGAGRPEAAAAIERVIDMYATEIGMDPAELRRRNLVASDAFPFTTPTGTTYDSGDYERALDLALDAAGYAELRAEQQRRRDAGETKVLGVGLSVYVEITGGVGPGEFGAVEVLSSGKVNVYTGTSPHGQGHETAWAMLAADQLGVAIEDVKVIHGDTDVIRSGGGTSGSRSLQHGGVAVHKAAVKLVDQARQLAAELLEANPDDITLDKVEGRFHVAGTPAISKTWADLAGAVASGAGSSVEGGFPAGLRADVDFASVGPTFPFGAHVAVVEVDTDTGRVTVDRMVAVDDAGRILNPLLAEGQVHGGLAQGVAQALMEEVRFDEDGNPVTSNLADYAMISATELPSFETVSMETPTPNNELGAKGIGESGTIGSTPAVHNAVVDALAYLGVRHVDMPTTPEKVWRAIVGAGR